MTDDSFFTSPRGYSDADLEMASLEAAGAASARGLRRAEQLYAAGDLAAAARCCDHGYGYPLKSLAASNCDDPGAGQDGYRCLNCGSRLDRDPFVDRDAVAVVPCEIPVLTTEPRAI